MGICAAASMTDTEVVPDLLTPVGTFKTQVFPFLSIKKVKQSNQLELVEAECSLVLKHKQ